MKIFLLSLVGT